jgi:membrane-bound lytic murein transglycosylase MltF
MNQFLPRYRQGSLLGNIAIRKYFENIGQIRLRVGDRGSRLSEYDELFKKYAQQYGFDWRLIAAVAYQESRFDQKARNRSGATGLFQIKPATAREPYIGIPQIAGEGNAEHNIHAGVKYLAWIKRRYFDPKPGMKEKDRVRMTLAAFNTGPAAVRRAIARAEAMNLDPGRWFRNVELSMLSLRRSEPVKYVSEVNKRYLSYVLLGVE